MKCTNANALFLQIQRTIKEVDSAIAAGADTTTQSHLARYLTVYIAGIYEQSIEEIIWEYAAKTRSLEVENFVANQVDKTFRNPDMGNIINLIKQFSSSWSDNLKTINSIHKDAIDSIVNNKNLIAHGSPCIITISDIKAYHANARVVIEAIDSLLL